MAAMALYAQPPEMEVTRGQFTAFTVSMPAMPQEKFIEINKAWAHGFTRRSGDFDASNVTGSSITISALKRNAFRYQNVGETVEVKIRYSLEITFTGNSYTLKFVVNDLYGDNDTLLDYKLPDYYKADGTLKDGYDGLESSLEDTVNEIVQSHYDYIVNYR
jgi:hypothetical protein